LRTSFPTLRNERNSIMVPSLVKYRNSITVWPKGRMPCYRMGWRGLPYRTLQPNIESFFSGAWLTPSINPSARRWFTTYFHDSADAVIHSIQTMLASRLFAIHSETHPRHDHYDRAHSQAVWKASNYYHYFTTSSC